MTQASEARRAEPRAEPAMPPRPKKPLTTLGLLRTFPTNSLAAIDDALFDELFVERRFFWGRVFVVSDPDGLRRVMQDNHANYVRIAAFRRIFEFSSGGGMGCLEGERWSHHRRIVNPALDQRALRGDLARLIELTTEMAALLAALPPGQQIELGRGLQHLITRTTAFVWAGGAPGVDEMVLRMSRYPEQYSVLDLLPAPEWLRSVGRRRGSRTGVDRYYEALDRLIAERRAPDYAGRKDLLWRLAHTPDRQTGETLTTAEIRDEILTLSATAATPLRTMTWLWYLLALHPWADDRLTEELGRVLGGHTPTPDDLPQLVYLRRLIDEAMRLYPPLPLTLRTAVADDTVCGRPVPRGSVVAVMPWVVHRHRKLWRDPDRFDPERFGPEEARGRPRYSYIPFGVGPHVCPGAALAMNEILITVAILAARFRFRLVPGQNIEPAAWTTLRPRHGIMVTVEPR